jgi:single-strand DNA-binding protein
MARSLNKAILIGNLTRDPELRYTPQGNAVCTLGLATNRQWTTDTGEKKEEADFHRLVSWNKLAELCAQLLRKGRKIYVEGRLQTRNWTAQDGSPRQTTEVVISDMIILDSRRDFEASSSGFDVPDTFDEDFSDSKDSSDDKKDDKKKAVKRVKRSPKPKRKASSSAKKAKPKSSTKARRKPKTDSEDDEIPF